MSIDYDDAYGRARPGHAFSNGTEWEIWSASWCDRCLREAPFRNGMSQTGCPLILVSLQALIPAEWMDQPDGSPDRYRCIEFRGPGGRGGGEPAPLPEPPDMDGLFPRPERQVRMLTQPAPAVVDTETVGALL